MLTISYTKFAVALVFLIIVYLVYIEISIYRLNMFIWKIRHMLGLVPIEIMIEKVDIIKKIIKELN